VVILPVDLVVFWI